MEYKDDTNEINGALVQDYKKGNYKQHVLVWNLFVYRVSVDLQIIQMKDMEDMWEDKKLFTLYTLSFINQTMMKFMGERRTGYEIWSFNQSTWKKIYLWWTL